MVEYISSSGKSTKYFHGKTAVKFIDDQRHKNENKHGLATCVLLRNLACIGHATEKIHLLHNQCELPLFQMKCLIRKLNTVSRNSSQCPPY